MEKEEIRKLIDDGRAILGIELGSTRIKAVLIDDRGNVLEKGEHGWENELTDGVWTYKLSDAEEGLKSCYADLKSNVIKSYGTVLRKLSAIGISAMMHGYLILDKNGEQLAPFRTWRNTITGREAKALTALFGVNVPERWSIAHLYKDILEDRPYVKDIAFMTTLSGYIHLQLTGESLLGIDDASGMFPIDAGTKDFDASMLSKFDAILKERGFGFMLSDILPKVLCAGEEAGRLTKEGALLLDRDGDLMEGCPLCPPEGDAGTGMVATDSVAPGTGNVSAGTSIFGSFVLEKPLSKVYPELDPVMTPSGDPVAMAHCNNGTSDIDAWVGLFAELLGLSGAKVEMGELYKLLFNEAMKAEKDCGGLISYGYLAGEPVSGVTDGRPLFVRTPDSRLRLAEFMRAQLLSPLASLRLGMDILFENENVKLSKLMGHGGFFKTKGVGQKLLAAAAKAPVTVSSTAGEGGAFGIAVLAAYMAVKAPGESLSDFLRKKIYDGAETLTMEPCEADMEAFERYYERFKRGLSIEREAEKAI